MVTSTTGPFTDGVLAEETLPVRGGIVAAKKGRHETRQGCEILA
jgi:hypothetical protein